MECVKKRRGFTLIELVIVVAIIGILAMMIIPQFNKITDEARTNVFVRNCKVIISAMGVYQAGHDGDLPADEIALGTVMEGGWDILKDGKGNFYPPGATYSYANGVFEASYVDSTGETHEYKYPR